MIVLGVVLTAPRPRATRRIVFVLLPLVVGAPTPARAAVFPFAKQNI
jgi:hypothetical protein